CPCLRQQQYRFEVVGIVLARQLRQLIRAGLSVRDCRFRIARDDFHECSLERESRREQSGRSRGQLPGNLIEQLLGWIRLAQTYPGARSAQFRVDRGIEIRELGALRDLQRLAERFQTFLMSAEVEQRLPDRRMQLDLPRGLTGKLLV